MFVHVKSNTSNSIRYLKQTLLDNVSYRNVIVNTCNYICLSGLRCHGACAMNGGIPRVVMLESQVQELTCPF